jgi:hypothetical protein
LLSSGYRLCVRAVVSASVLDTGPVSLQPRGAHRAVTSLARLVVILRQPRSRVVSMFADQRHLAGLDGDSAAALASAMANRSEANCRHVRKGRKADRAVCVEVALLLGLCPHAWSFFSAASLI